MFDTWNNLMRVNFVMKRSLFFVDNRQGILFPNNLKVGDLCLSKRRVTEKCITCILNICSKIGTKFKLINDRNLSQKTIKHVLLDFRY